MPVHYPALYRPHWPVLLPALSNSYTDYMRDLRANPKRTLPAPYTLDDLNFLNSNSRFFSIGDCLYSFGLLVGKDGKVPPPDLVTDRQGHDARVMADSGGYQAVEGKLKVGMDKWVPSLVDFVNEYCDWSPICDLPTAAIDHKKFQKHLKKLTSNGGYDPEVIERAECKTLYDLMQRNGLDECFNTCLWYTKYNAERLIRTPGWNQRTKWINVIQGRTLRESAAFVDEMKGYPFAGVAFPASHKTRLEQTLNALFRLRNALPDYRRVHYLGTAASQNLVAYAAIQQELHRIGYSEMMTTTDVASMFKETGRAIVVGVTLGRTQWTHARVKWRKLHEFWPHTPMIDALQELWTRAYFKSGPKPKLITDERSVHYDGDGRYFVRSEISKALTVGDVLVNIDGELKPDELGYLCLWNHMIQVYTEATIIALEAYDAGDNRLVMPQLVDLQAAIRSVFASADPLMRISELAHMLNFLEAADNSV